VSALAISEVEGAAVGAVWRKWATALSQLRPDEEESQWGRLGRPGGRVLVGRGRAGRLGRKGGGHG
jgi:hypothetical protein